MIDCIVGWFVAVNYSPLVDIAEVPLIVDVGVQTNASTASTVEFAAVVRQYLIVGSSHNWGIVLLVVQHFGYELQ